MITAAASPNGVNGPDAKGRFADGNMGGLGTPHRRWIGLERLEPRLLLSAAPVVDALYASDTIPTGSAAQSHQAFTQADHLHDPAHGTETGRNLPRSVESAWKWPDSRLSVNYYVNTSNLPAGVSAGAYISAIDNAFEAWESLSTTYLTFNRIGTGTQFDIDVADGVTTIGFGTALAGALAHAKIHSDGLGITEFDVVLGGDRATWSTNGGIDQVDVWAAAAHEIGHGIGLEHHDHTSATMYEAIFTGSTQQRYPGSDDIAGLEQLYSPRPDHPPTVPGVRVEAVLVTHSTAGTLFFDGLEEPVGASPVAEVGHWVGSFGVSEMISGAVPGGPAGAANGRTYLERWRGPGSSRSGAPAIMDLEAVFTQPVATGQLHIEFMYWNTDDWQSVGILDNNVGVQAPASDGAAYILSKISAGSATEWWDNIGGGGLPGGSTGVALNLGQWNKMEIDIDLDRELTEVKVNGVSGGVYNGGDSVVSRLYWRPEANNLGHFIDATSVGVPTNPSFAVPSGQRQLFLDNHGVAEIQNLSRVMHQPEKRGPVITSPIPTTTIQTRTAPDWDPQHQVYKTWTIREGQLFHQSSDGINWSPGPDPNMHVQLVVYDGSDPDPNRRFKAVLPNVGVAVSPDGINWSMVPGVPGIPSDDEYNFSFDQQNHRFILTVKRTGSYGRAIALATSDDFTNWTDYGLIFQADAEDQVRAQTNIAARFADPTLQDPEYNIPSFYAVDVYNMGIFRYEGLYLGLPTMFHHTGTVSPNWSGFEQMNLSPYIEWAIQTYGDYTGFHHVQLTSSRDLLNWQRLGDRQPFIDASTIDSGNYDLQSIIGPSYPVVHGDELWFYYTGIKQYAFITSGREPGYDDYVPYPGAVMLAVLRRDGFVSLDANDQPGSILTEPFVLTDEALFVNVDAISGWLSVEVLDENGQVAATSKLQRGDITFGQVDWTQGSFADLLGETISLRFTLQNGNFYAYGVGIPDAPEAGSTPYRQTRMKDGSATGFDLALEREEAAGRSSTFSSIGYLAIDAVTGQWNGLDFEAGYVGDLVDHTWHGFNFNSSFSSAPNLIASLAGYNGADNAHSRLRSVTVTGSQVKVEEDTTWDGDTNHGTEDISYLAIDGAGRLSAVGAAGFIGEVGQVGLDHLSKTVSLQGNYVNPVVFALANSFNGNQPIVTVVTQVDSTELRMQLAEPSDLDGTHAQETVTYLVLELGRWTLADGTTLEVGVVSTDANVGSVFGGNWQRVDFTLGFAGMPAIFSQIQPAGMAIGQFGQVSVSDVPKTVILERSYVNPVVFALPPSYSGPHPVVVRILDIQSDRFTMALREPGNLDGVHGFENVNYMVLEAGQWFLPDGTKLEVGTVDTAATVGPQIPNVWETVSLDSSFSTTPVLLSQIQTPGGAPLLKTRMRHQMVGSFEVALEKPQFATTPNGSQTVGYLAIEPGAGQWGSFDFDAGYSPDAVTQAWYLMPIDPSVSDPKFLASLAGYDGTDPASLRYRVIGGTDLWVKVEEDTTFDAEVDHTTEKVAYLALEGEGVLIGGAVSVAGGSGTPTIGELGQASVSDAAMTVILQRPYVNPVVFALPPTYSGIHQVVVRIPDIQSDRFMMVLREPGNLDGGHGFEKVNYLVLEAGTWKLSDGTLLEVGTVETAATVGPQITNVWETVNLDNSFSTTPVVLSQIQNLGSEPFLKTRMRHQTAGSFEVALEQPQFATTPSTSQTVGYLAIGAGTGQWSGFNYDADYTADAVTDNWHLMNFNSSFGQVPKLLASLAGYDGADPSSLRYRETAGTDLWVKVEEDTTFDGEVAHTTEKVAYLAIEGEGFLSANPVTISGGSAMSQSPAAATRDGSAAPARTSTVANLNQLVAFLLADLDEPAPDRSTLQPVNQVLQVQMTQRRRLKFMRAIGLP